MEKTILKDRIILIDADHADAVAADLRSNFKRMLGREIPAADMASWLVCCALDAGWKTEQGEVQVVFVHSAACRKLSHFLPANLEKEVDGQAFRDDKLGEFLLSAVTEEDINAGKPLFVQCVQALVEDKKKRSVVLGPDMARYGDLLDEQLAADRQFEVTLLSMQPHSANGVNHVLTGFGLMHAMGIRPEEFD